MKPAKFKILIGYRRKYFHVADVSINVSGGDVCYLHAGELIVGNNDLIPSGSEPDHISYHRDGNIHAKDKDDKKYSTTKRLPIQDIGFQPHIRDEISNITELPQMTELVDEEKDCVLKLPDEKEAGVVVGLSIISGRLIVRQQAAVKRVGESGLIDAQHRAIGVESGNADKMIQIALESGQTSPSGTLRRRIVIPPPNGIARPPLIG